MEIIFNKDFIEIMLKEEVLSVHWKEPSTAEEFKIAMNAFLEAYKKHTPTFFLIDSRKQGVMSNDLQKWFADKWKKTQSPEHSQYTALVLSEDLLEKMAFDDLIDKIRPYKTETIRKFFTNEIDALLWIESVKTLIDNS